MAMENTHLHAVVDQDGAAILDLDRGRVSMLNPTGAHVWQGIQRGDALEDVISSLAHETGEDIQVIDLFTALLEGRQASLDERTEAKN